MDREDPEDIAAAPVGRADIMAAPVGRALAGIAVPRWAAECIEDRRWVAECGGLRARRVAAAAVCSPCLRWRRPCWLRCC